MPNRTILLALVATAAGAGLAAMKPADKGPVPTFRCEGYALACTELDCLAKLDLAERGQKEYAVEMDAVLAAPKHEDAVAAGDKLKAVEAFGAQREDLLKRDIRAKGKTPKDDGRSFAPVLDGKAELKLDKLQLTANPYALRSLTVEVEVIVAKERQNQRLAAAVMGEEAALVPGLSVRIEGLTMSPKRECSISVRFTRTQEGPAGPFVEQLWVLDADGAELGGGRWTQGKPFGKTGTIGGKFILAGGAPAKFVRLVAVTRCDVKTLQFKVEGIFQK